MGDALDRATVYWGTAGVIRGNGPGYHEYKEWHKADVLRAVGLIDIAARCDVCKRMPENWIHLERNRKRKRRRARRPNVEA